MSFAQCVNSSKMTGSSDFLPNPKYLRVESAKRLCCFHRFPLLKIIPDKNEGTNRKRILFYIKYETFFYTSCIFSRGEISAVIVYECGQTICLTNRETNKTFSHNTGWDITQRKQTRRMMKIWQNWDVDCADNSVVKTQFLFSFFLFSFLLSVYY